MIEKIDFPSKTVYVNAEKKFHSENDAPAVIYKTGPLAGAKEWYNNGICHREGNPALIFENGNKEWWNLGKPHRIGGPAIDYITGERHWYRSGEMHRFNAPAVIMPSGYMQYWEFGIKIK
jgi:hypothetical protein